MKQMKKILSISILICFVVLLCACGKKENKNNPTNTGTGGNGGGSSSNTMECVHDTTNTTDNYSIHSKYTVYHNGKYVEKIKIDKTISSSESDVVDYMKTSYDTSYDNMQRLYGGYTYTSTLDGGSAVYDITIDCLTIKMKELSNDFITIIPYIDEDNHISLEGVRTIYESRGATCK